MRRPQGLQSATGLLIGVLAKIDPARARELQLRTAWPQIVGPDLAGRTQVSLIEGRVRVIVDDLRWVRELRSLEGILRKRIAAAIGKVAAIDVRFEPEPSVAASPAAVSRSATSRAATSRAAGSRAAGSRAAPTGAAPPPPDPVPAPPPPPGLAAAVDLDRAAAGIADPVLRERLRAVAGTYIAERNRRGRESR